MRIALYDEDEEVLKKYQGMIEDYFNNTGHKCKVDGYTDRSLMAEKLSSYDLALMNESAIKYVLRMNQREELILISGNRIETIPVRDIVYVEADLKQVHLHTNTGGEVVIRIAFHEVERQLLQDNNDFVKIHRSYIVAMGMIQSIDNKVMILKNGAVLSISKYRLAEVRKSYLAYKERQDMKIHDINNM